MACYTLATNYILLPLEQIAPESAMDACDAALPCTTVLLLLLLTHAGHNLAMSLWGGLTPFIVSAMALGMQPAALAAGVLIVVIAVVSWVAAIPLIAIAPQTNATDGWSCCGLLETETEMTGSTHTGDLA